LILEGVAGSEMAGWNPRWSSSTLSGPSRVMDASLPAGVDARSEIRDRIQIGCARTLLGPRRRMESSLTTEDVARTESDRGILFDLGGRRRVGDGGMESSLVIEHVVRSESGHGCLVARRSRCAFRDTGQNPDRLCEVVARSEAPDGILCGSPRSLPGPSRVMDTCFASREVAHSESREGILFDTELVACSESASRNPRCHRRSLVGPSRVDGISSKTVAEGKRLESRDNIRCT
jgi:hypothetical protein